MTSRLESHLLTEAEQQRSALSWLLQQWTSDVDREHADWALDGLRHEDPDLFAVLDAIHFDDTGEPLISDLPFQDGSDAAAVSDGGSAAATPDGGPPHGTGSSPAGGASVPPTTTPPAVSPTNEKCPAAAATARGSDQEGTS